MQLKSLVRTSDIAKASTAIVVRVFRNKRNGDSHFTVRPDLPDLRLDLEDVVLKKEHIIINGLSDILIFPGQLELSLLLPFLHDGLFVSFIVI